MGSLSGLHVSGREKPVTGASRRPAGWGRALSARRVRDLVSVDQLWECADGTVWRVAGIHRADRQVRLLRMGAPGRRYDSFKRLGKDYRLVADVWR